MVLTLNKRAHRSREAAMLRCGILKQFWCLKTVIHFLLVACLSQITGEAAYSWSMGEHGLLPGSDTRISARVSLVRASHRPHLSSTGQECISFHGKGTESQ